MVHIAHSCSRRLLLQSAGFAGLALASRHTEAAVPTARFAPPLPGGPNERDLVTDFPQKSQMILQRTRPPLLETPFDVFDKGVFTPNDRFFVRWHLAGVPNDINTETFRLAVRGHVQRPLSLTLDELLALPQIEYAAVNQCSGNSRGYFEPRVAGGQWADGAMGNAVWTGVRLSDVLDRAGVKAGAVQVRFSGLDEPVLPKTPKFLKSLDVDHARDGEVMIAYAMNGKALPVLNGFPIRLVVPAWYATYWVKMLNDIEVLEHPDDNFWMTKAYTIPDTPGANVKPGETGFKMVPISRMVPRSFLTNLRPGDRLKTGVPTVARGIAFGGDTGVGRVEFSSDGGSTWQNAQLGPDHGKYSFREWNTSFTLQRPGDAVLKVRCINANGVAQPETANWNPAGFMRNVIEATSVAAG